MFWLLTSLAILIGLAFIVSVIAAIISSARETREEEGVSFEPDPTAGRGSDVFGRR